MSKKGKDIWLLILLLIALLIVNYQFLDDSLKRFLDTSEEVHVDRIIDGDTLESNETSIRLLGINTPERDELFYQEAKEFLENLVLNETATLEFTKDRFDKYGRTLAYIFLNGDNINVKMVENGFANYYFYDGKDKYSDELLGAWKKCIDSNKNLCEKSNNICAECVNINLNSIVNSCDFGCNISGWIVKGEGREKFVFNQTLEPGANSKFDLDLSNTYGSLFLRDEQGNLVLWKINL